MEEPAPDFLHPEPAAFEDPTASDPNRGTNVNDAPGSVTELDERMTRPDEAVLQSLASCEGDFAVLGAGGKMGYHVARMLARGLERLGRHDAVTAVSRFTDSASATPFREAEIPTLAADLSDPRQVDALPEFANVVYLAGVKFGTGSDPALLRRMNVDMPRLIARRYRDARIVALSTGCVYSFVDPESGGSKEDDATDPPGDYARSCLGREQAFVEGSRRHGTRCTLVRLNYAIDLRYGVLVDVAQKVLAGQPVDVETGYVNVIWQGDAVAQILRCFDLVAAPPAIINITGVETLKVREVAQEFARRWDLPVTIRGHEAATAWLSNSGRARDLFGPPRVSPQTMIDWISQWLRQGGETLGKPTHFEVRSGRY